MIIESRGGAVLGAVTILKEDYFPGMKSSRLPQLLPGGAACCCLAGSCWLMLVLLLHAVKPSNCGSWLGM